MSRDFRVRAVLGTGVGPFCNNSAIELLLKAKRLFSVTGKTRINDSILLGTEPFFATGSTSE